MKLTYKELTTLVKILEKEVGYAEERYKEECESREKVKAECLEKVEKGEMTWNELEYTIKYFDEFCSEAWHKRSTLDDILNKITEEVEI